MYGFCSDLQLSLLCILTDCESRMLDMIHGQLLRSESEILVREQCNRGKTLQCKDVARMLDLDCVAPDTAVGERSFSCALLKHGYGEDIAYFALLEQ